jgi:hypothetical protein
MSSYKYRYLLTAPVIVVLGLTAAFWGRRAAAFGSSVRHWADSLDHGSGPVRIVVPLPVYVSGARVGNLDTIVVERHAMHTVDSLRVVVKSVQLAKLAELSSCAVRVQSLNQFDPGEYPRALSCATDTAGLTRFGTVSFAPGHDVVLYMDASDVACLRPEVADVPAPAKGVKAVTIPAHSCGRHVNVNGAEIQRMVRQAQLEARRAGTEARVQARDVTREEVRAQVRQAVESAGAVRHNQ